MATVQRSATRVAWSVKKQSAFGTALDKTDLTRFLRLADPIIINEAAEHWTDRGMIGTFKGARSGEEIGKLLK